MDWTKEDQARYHASRSRFDTHPKWQAFPKSAGSHNPKIQARPVPGDVGSLPPRERIERDPDFYRLTDGQVGGPGKKTIARGKGKAKTPTEMTSQRRYRKADRVKRPIELA